jgi:RNA-directed DNA polymerase
VEHEKLLTLVPNVIADGRVLRLIEAMLKAGSYGERATLSDGARDAARRGSITLAQQHTLTPFDQEMRRKGYQLTRYADDWVVTCKSAAEARAAIEPQRLGS